MANQLAQVGLREEQGKHLAELGVFIRDLLSTIGGGESSILRLITHAEKWVPGDPSVDWRGVVDAVLNWGQLRGDFRVSSGQARILPARAFGPFQARDGRWIAHLHGAAPKYVAQDGTIEVVRYPVVEHGVGVGAVARAVALNERTLQRFLESVDVAVSQWPVSKELLLLAGGAPTPARGDPIGIVDHLRLRQQFGGFEWTSRPDVGRSLMRVTDATAGSTRRRYFVTADGRPEFEIRWAKVVHWVWRLHATRLGHRPPVTEIVRVEQDRLTFVTGNVPTYLTECLLVYDGGSGLNRFPVSFTIPEGMVQFALQLIGQYLGGLEFA